jgi:uncharacterized NAD-dependent epimerase/dehydratase family protein
MDRFVILAEGQLGVFSAKTATSVMRYRPHEVVAVLDSRFAGRTAREVLGVACDAPVVASLEAALPLQPSALLIGIAPPGGQLPPAWRAIIRDALNAGLDVISGLHRETFPCSSPRKPPALAVGTAKRQGGSSLDTTG